MKSRFINHVALHIFPVHAVPARLATSTHSLRPLDIHLFIARNNIQIKYRIKTILINYYIANAFYSHLHF
jgi:type II secretory ATPase GspE/PulE/Tfp pilus assembly ATPase PilB-like protein